MKKKKEEVKTEVFKHLTNILDTSTGKKPAFNIITHGAFDFKWIIMPKKHIPYT